MTSDNERATNDKPESDKEAEESEEYVVERIVDVRNRRGGKEYFIKWSGYADSENTWEPEGNLACPELIEEFKKKRAEEQSKRESLKRRHSSDSEVTSSNTNAAKVIKKEKKKKVENAQNGFEKGFKVEAILGASETLGELSFLIKWKEAVDPEIIPSRIANIKCPADVIKFYEQRLIWEEPPNNSINGSNTVGIAINQVDANESDK